VSYVLEDQFLPGDMEPFADIMIESMPARLTIDTWIVEPVLAEVSRLLTGSTERASEFQQWQDGYGEEDRFSSQLRTELCSQCCPSSG